MRGALIHDVAWIAKLSIMEVFDRVLRDEEKADAGREVYERVKAALEAFCIQDARMQQRMNPSKN